MKEKSELLRTFQDFLRDTHNKEKLKSFSCDMSTLIHDDDTQYLDEGLTKMGGNQEYYLALDYNIEEILKKWDSPLAKKVKFFLKYVKLPAPTIRFTPELKFYPFFI